MRVVSGTRSEGVASARRLLRTFASAPDARRRAHEIFQALARIDGLTQAERAAVAELGAWLAQKPSSTQLKPRCETLLAAFR